MKSLQLEKPHAIIVIGIQGSGKSFFASKFADTFNAPYFDQGSLELLAKNQDAAAALLRHSVEQLAKTGRSFVLELTLASKLERTELAGTLRKAGYVPLFVWVQTDTETSMNRAMRSTGVSANEYQTQMRRFSPPHVNEKPLVISGKHTFATQAKAVLKRLSAPRQTSVRPSVEPRQQTRGQIIVR